MSIKGMASLAALLVSLAGGIALAGDADSYRDHVKTGNFANVRDDLKDAIINRGYVIDFTGHFSAMLDRTAAVAGGGAKPRYANAEYLQFCPAKLAHEATAASPFYIANCPVTIYVFELKSEPGKVHVGYRLPVASTEKGIKDVNAKLEAMLEAMTKEVTR